MNPPSEDSKVRIIKRTEVGKYLKSPSVLGREAAAVNVRSLTPKILGWQEPAKLFKCWRLVEGRNVSILNSPDLDVPIAGKIHQPRHTWNSKAERSPKADKIEFCGTIHISSG